jgi:hypothetical protein
LHGGLGFLLVSSRREVEGFFNQGRLSKNCGMVTGFSGIPPGGVGFMEIWWR